MDRPADSPGQHCESSTVVGACRPQAAILYCGGMRGLEVEVVRTADAGTCTFTLTLKDSWGLRGTSDFTFDIARLLR